jgi:hypothetical protein
VWKTIIQKYNLEQLHFEGILLKFHDSKRSTTRVKRQHIQWEKVFANYSSDKGLISRRYKEHKKIKHQKDHTKKWANELNRHS